MITDPSRLFLIRPEQILEHPTDLPADPLEIPEGLFDGWMVYAANLKGDPSKVLGPFPVFIEKERSEGQIRPYINIPGDYQYWLLKTEELPAWCKIEKPCWYQSGYTLRFVRK